MEASSLASIPDPEVTGRPARRRFSAAYKLKILEDADRCANPGELGALLRREGLYASHLAAWRKARRTGSLSALGQKRGRKPQRTPETEEIMRLRRENARLRAKLARAETIIDVQKKLAAVLGIELETPDSTESD
jgi:transposase-like protein